MTDQSLSGRVAIVTGAGRGLGRAMALGLARADADRTIRRLLDATWALGGLAGALGLARSERYR